MHRDRDVRSLVLADHDTLRALLGKVRELAGRVTQGHTDAVGSLRERGLELHHRLCEHLDFEDRHLLPALHASGEAEQAEELAREHTEQRLLFEYILSRLRDQNRPTLVLGCELRSFAELLLDDMEREEREVLDPLEP